MRYRMNLTVEFEADSYSDAFRLGDSLKRRVERDDEMQVIADVGPDRAHRIQEVRASDDYSHSKARR